MARSILDIIIKTTKQGGGDKETIKSFVQLRSGLLEAAAVAGVVVGAYYAVDKAIEATVGEFVRYADEVRNISQITGESAESTSRLLQVTDDYKISTEELAKAQKALAKEGFNLTTASLAALSDEYLKINDGQERMNFLTEHFGKSGAAFAEIMLAGGDAIRERSEAVQDSLILDQKAIDVTREYQRQQDELSDAFRGLKVAVGEWALPAVLDFTDAAVEGMRGAQLLASAQKLGIKVTTDQYTGLIFLNGELITEAELLELVAKASEEAARQAYYFAGGANEAEIAAAKMKKTLKGVTEDYKDQLDFILKFAGDYENFTKDITGNTADMAVEWVASYAKMEESMSGVFVDKGEMDFILGLAGALDQMTDAEVKAALDAWELKNQLEAIMNMPEEIRKKFVVDVDLGGLAYAMQMINYPYSGIGGLGIGPHYKPTTGGGWVRAGPGWEMNAATGEYREAPWQKAGGGPVSASVPYIVGERGPELFVPRSNGTIVPNNQLSGAMNNSGLVAAIDRLAAIMERVPDKTAERMQRLIS